MNKQNQTKTSWQKVSRIFSLLMPALFFFSGYAQAGILFESVDPAPVPKRTMITPSTPSSMEGEVPRKPAFQRSVDHPKEESRTPPGISSSKVVGSNGLSVFAERSNIPSSGGLIGPLGFGNKMSLRDVFSQVSPSKPKIWKLFCAASICDEQNKVNWSSDGSSTWKDVFANAVLAIDDNVEFSFNENEHTAYVLLPLNRVTSWKVVGNESLQENIKRWSADVGWMLNWGMPDDVGWNTGVDFSLSGNYKDAIAKLLGSFSSRGVYLGAKMYKNKVIKISRHSTKESLNGISQEFSK